MIYDSIALCGGGGKGAYQVGVMKALKETGILKNIKYISGTSVGALNAILYAIKDIQLAENVWLKYVNPEVMIKNVDLQRYELSRDGLKSMLRYIGVGRIKSGPMVFVYVHNVRNNQPEAFLLNDKSENDIISLLLASSSIPVVYSPIEFHGEKYKDGGCTAIGNYPIKVLADNDRKNILLVPLNSNFNPYAVSNSIFEKKINLYDLFPNIEFQIVKPSMDIGKFIDGCIDFKQESIRKRMVLGYNDAIDIFNNKGGFVMDANVNFRIRKLAEEVLKTSHDFEDFVSLSSFKNLNIKIKVIRAEICFDTIFRLNGWSIEWHKITPMKKHYRIIDPNDYRRAWTLDPDEIVKKSYIVS